jgi:hypothetical protein
MIPVLAAMAVVSVASAAYTAYKNGEISEEEYARAQQDAEEYQRAVEELGDAAPPPQYSPELIGILAKYNPELPMQIQEAAPEMISESESVTEKGLQRDVLSKLSQLSETGDDAISLAQREQAAFDADSNAKRRRDQVVKDMAQRGLGGSGADILTQMQAQQDANVTERQAALDAAAGAQGRRYDALNKLGSLAGQVRGQNTDVESLNRNIMNSFKQRTASAKQIFENNRANTMNEAQQYNVGNENSRNIQNVGIKNQGQMTNQNRDIAYQDKVRGEKLGNLAMKYRQNSKLSDMYANNARQASQDQDKIIGSGISAAQTGVGYYQGQKEAERAGVTRDLSDELLKAQIAKEKRGY